MKHSIAWQILHRIRKNGPAMTRDIATEFDMTIGRAAAHLHDLKRRGLLTVCGVIYPHEGEIGRPRHIFALPPTEAPNRGENK